MKCRLCKSEVAQVFLDLGESPISNRFLTKKELLEPEPFWPLCVMVCNTCNLVQVDEFETRGDIFNEDYAYFSSFSTYWLDHCARFVDESVEKYNLNHKSFVVEIASNDGYLLKNYIQKKIPCLGVEPCGNVADAAKRVGVQTEVVFFGKETAKRICEEYGKANLIIANNVLAHVPDLHDFIGGFHQLLAETGSISFEFPHVLELINNTQFDTIYHEHFSYLSLTALRPLFEEYGLEMVDAETLSTHGGSLRLTVCHKNFREPSSKLHDTVERERKAKLHVPEGYIGFQTKVDAVRDNLLELLTESKNAGKMIAGYGAAAKGNTLLNYCSVGTDLISWIADANPHKQGRFTPGMRIPIVSLDKFKEDSPEEVLVLPWNIYEEIVSFLKTVEPKMPSRAIIPIPTPRIVEL